MVESCPPVRSIIHCISHSCSKQDKQALYYLTALLLGNNPAAHGVVLTSADVITASCAPLVKVRRFSYGHVRKQIKITDNLNQGYIALLLVFFRKWFWQELIFGMTTMSFGLGKPSPGQKLMRLPLLIPACSGWDHHSSYFPTND